MPNSLYSHAMQQLFDPNRGDFEPYGLSVCRWQPTAMNRTDRHNEIELNFVISEPVTFQIGGRRVVVPAGGITVFWAAIPHQLISPVGKDFYYVATVPLSTYLRFGLPDAMVQELFGGVVLTTRIDSVLPAADRQIEMWIEDLKSPDARRQMATTLEIQSLLLRIWLVTTAADKSCGTTFSHSLQHTDVSAVERIAAYIALHFKQPLTVDEISEAVGLSSGYAMTLFRKVFGKTVIGYLLDHRLAHAQRLLISTDDQILTIAYESGFGSVSRFNTVFKQHCHCSPRAYRQQHRHASEPRLPGV